MTSRSANANAERRTPGRGGDPRLRAHRRESREPNPSPRACLDLVARHVDEFDRIHVAAAMHRLARLAQRDNNSSAGVVPESHDVSATIKDGATSSTRGDMCDARELDARAHASVVHSVAAAVDAGAVEMTSTGVYDLLTSLERKTPDALEKRPIRLAWRSGEFAVGVRQDRVAAVAGDVGGDRAFGREGRAEWGDERGGDVERGVGVRDAGVGADG